MCFPGRRDETNEIIISTEYNGRVYYIMDILYVCYLSIGNY